MKQIVCLSADPWQRTPSRTRRLLSRFTDAEIIYFVPGVKHGEVYDGEEVGPRIWLYSLPVLSVAGNGVPRFSLRAKKKFLRVIAGVLDYHRIENALFWVGSPLYNDLLDVLPHGGILYDCDRDWSRYPVLWESRLTSRADLVLAASAGLADRLSPCSDHIVILPNGFNIERFDPDKLETLECPPELYSTRRPIFGYTGTIWSNLNLEPVIYTATRHLSWTFVFIGKVNRANPWLNKLAKLPNVRILGARTNSQIPAFVANFDVGISLMRDGMEDDDILSPRIYEYMAAGIPIVAMYHHLHREEYPLHIDSAYSPEGFMEMCEKVLEHDSVVRRAERQEIARSSSWENRAETVSKLISGTLLMNEVTPNTSGVDNLVNAFLGRE